MAHKENIVVQNVVFSYGENEAIRGISATFDPGKFIGIVGPNGCGKSTFLDLLIGIKKASKGKVILDGHEIGNYSKKELALRMALVPQKFFINFPFTVMEVLMMGRHPYIPRFSSPSASDYKIVEKVAHEFGLTDFLSRLVTELSGGEIQRVVVARAVVQDTPFLLLDEATSNMDIKHTLDILNGLKARVAKKGCTVISVMHDLNLAAMFCDEILILRDGMLHSQGEVSEILTGETIREVFEVNAEVVKVGANGNLRIFFNEVIR